MTNSVAVVSINGLNTAIQEVVGRFDLVVSEKAAGILPEWLAKCWKISHDDAQYTIEPTTQLGRYQHRCHHLPRVSTND